MGNILAVFKILRYRVNSSQTKAHSECQKGTHWKGSVKKAVGNLQLNRTHLGEVDDQEAERGFAFCPEETEAFYDYTIPREDLHVFKKI